MADEKLPRLTEAQIRNLASESSFERGENYYHDGAVLELVRQEMELRAQCEGSDYEPYQVSARLAKGGIAETSCTCPYDYDATDFDLPLANKIQKSREIAQHSARLIFANLLLFENLLMFG